MREYEHLLFKRDGDTVTITMNRPGKRNSLTAEHLEELRTAMRQAAETEASGVVLAGAGPVFSAGHDFGDVAVRDQSGVRDLLELCTDVMRTVQRMPQRVIARVHGRGPAGGGALAAAV